MTNGQSYVKSTVSAAIKKKKNTSSPRASGPHYGTERSSQGGRVLKAGRGRGPIYGSGQMDTLAQKKGALKKKKISKCRDESRAAPCQQDKSGNITDMSVSVVSSCLHAHRLQCWTGYK